jgi:hypothetical protein
MDDIERLHRMFREEVTTACWAFFVWKGINNSAFDDQQIYDSLNENALSWNTILHSLQTTSFVMLGRLFDVDNNAFSIHALLKACILNIDQFSIESLRERKVRDLAGKLPEWLDGYLAEAYVPREKDFQLLRGETSKYQREYETVYRPIRNKVIAHKDRQAIDIIDKLFEKTGIEHIQQLLMFTYQIERVVFELLHNGKLTKIGDHYFDEEDYVQKDVVALLQRI